MVSFWWLVTCSRRATAPFCCSSSLVSRVSSSLERELWLSSVLSSALTWLCASRKSLLRRLLSSVAAVSLSWSCLAFCEACSFWSVAVDSSACSFSSSELWATWAAVSFFRRSSIVAVCWVICSSWLSFVLRRFSSSSVASVSWLRIFWMFSSESPSSLVMLPFSCSIVAVCPTTSLFASASRLLRSSISSPWLPLSFLSSSIVLSALRSCCCNALSADEWSWARVAFCRLRRSISVRWFTFSWWSDSRLLSRLSFLSSASPLAFLAISRARWAVAASSSVDSRSARILLTCFSDFESFFVSSSTCSFVDLSCFSSRSAFLTAASFSTSNSPIVAFNLLTSVRWLSLAAASCFSSDEIVSLSLRSVFEEVLSNSASWSFSPLIVSFCSVTSEVSLPFSLFSPRFAVSSDSFSFSSSVICFSWSADFLLRVSRSRRAASSLPWISLIFFWESSLSWFSVLLRLEISSFLSFAVFLASFSWSLSWPICLSWRSARSFSPARADWLSLSCFSRRLFSIWVELNVSSSLLISASFCWMTSLWEAICLFSPSTSFACLASTSWAFCSNFSTCSVRALFASVRLLISSFSFLTCSLWVLCFSVSLSLRPWASWWASSSSFSSLSILPSLPLMVVSRLWISLSFWLPRFLRSRSSCSTLLSAVLNWSWSSLTFCWFCFFNSLILSFKRPTVWVLDWFSSVSSLILFSSRSSSFWCLSSACVWAFLRVSSSSFAPSLSVSTRVTVAWLVFNSAWREAFASSSSLIRCFSFGFSTLSPW